MNILYLCTFYHMAMLYSQQKHGLERRGHTVCVFNSAQFGSEVRDKFIPVIQDEHVVHARCWNSTDRILFFPRQMKIERALVRAYDLRKFDLMHAHLLVSSGFTARRMKQKYGLKYVVSIRATDLNGFIRLPFFRQMAIRNAEEASGLLFLSRTHRDEFFRRFVPDKKRAALEEKSVVIGNPLEKIWEEQTARPRESLGQGPVRLLLIGRINPVKNIPAAAEAVRLLRARGIEATLTVVGEVEDQREEKKLGAYADFLTQMPFLPHEELIKVYRKHDIFILPSIVETFGRVYVEAMSQGLPVIYSKGQGFDGTYPDGEVGYGVPCNDPAFIAKKIEAVMNDYPRLSANCIAHVREFYEDAIIDEIEAFYLNSFQ